MTKLVCLLFDSNARVMSAPCLLAKSLENTINSSVNSS